MRHGCPSDPGQLATTQVCFGTAVALAFGVAIAQTERDGVVIPGICLCLGATGPACRADLTGALTTQRARTLAGHDGRETR